MEKIANDHGHFCDLNNGNIQLQNGYCDFSGKSNLKNKKNNKKYYLYQNHGIEKVKAENYNSMELIAVEKHGEEQVIFYSDANKNISFIKSKLHKSLNPMQIADKCEKNPMLRTFMFVLFSSLWAFGILRYREYSFKDITISVGYDKTKNYSVHFLFPKRIRNKFSFKTDKLSLLIHLYWVRISLKDLYSHYKETSEINNPMYIKVENENINYYYNFKEKTRDQYNKNHFVFNTLSTKIPNTEVEMYVRKSITGQYVIVVSSRMSKFVVLKEVIAYIFSLFKRNKNKYDIYFEKFAQGASESGYELFKYSITKNQNSIYILDKKNVDFDSMKRKYPNNLFAKNSLQSFYHIFLARSFISSDLVTHVQRRLYDNDSLLKKKILNNKYKIFLQHGVSLATNVFERGYYNKKVPIAPDYIIVNSQLEKEFFLKNTSYKSNELIISGLPNLDIYVNSKEIKKEEITFLLTWRPWDLTGKIEEDSYLYRYLQFISLIENDSYYKDKKINIVLHPKAKIILQEQFTSFFNKNKHHFYEGDIKNALLNSKVLISDYSSVTFMCFSGGTNVIFYWEDKQRSEKEYGAPNILQANNAFGHIVYEFEKLNRVIKANFNAPQSNKHINKFNKMVECTDGNNTKNTFDALNNII
ncbi:CDP-glycerol glycerophosphotransferase family protein [Virgibacillus salexigens]|nr:CDP-glycerol glycerophosphotransferase family protein [Virgibacillus kapii]